MKSDDCCNYKKEYCSSTLSFLFSCLLHVVAAGHSRRGRKLREAGNPQLVTIQLFCVCAKRMCDDDKISEPAPATGSELHDAVRRQDVIAVERLLSQGADPDEPDWAGSGDAPLLHAAAAGSVQVVRCIVVLF